MRGFANRPDEPQDCRVKRLVKIGEVFVEPVDGQNILNQIIRPNAEELDLRGESRPWWRIRRFDHDAQRHPWRGETAQTSLVRRTSEHPPSSAA